MGKIFFLKFSNLRQNFFTTPLGKIFEIFFHVQFTII